MILGLDCPEQLRTDLHLMHNASMVGTCHTESAALKLDDVCKSVIATANTGQACVNTMHFAHANRLSWVLTQHGRQGLDCYADDCNMPQDITNRNAQ